ncbi:MAG: UPF0104 family protein [Candidatus Dadabacteria bacterium]|nr:MAG: UPF0104 family protein [Candidatus Dadabacteria bacterium]
MVKLRIALSAVISIAVLYLVFSRIDAGDIYRMLTSVDKRFLLVFMLLSVTMSLFRVWRYLLLLDISGFRPSKIRLFLVVLARNLCSDLLPARLGSLVYILLVTLKLGVSLPAATSSFALAFIFDLIAVVPLVIAALILGASRIEAINSHMLLAASGTVLLLLVILLKFLPQIFGATAAVLSRSGTDILWIQRIQQTLTASAEELKKASRAGVYLKVLLLSLIVRVSKYASLYVFALALLIQHGIGIFDVNVESMFLAICSAEFAASLPVSGIAGFGAYEGTWMVAFKMLGFSSKLAALTAVSHHLFTQLWGYSLGVLAFIILAALPAKKDK